MLDQLLCRNTYLVNVFTHVLFWLIGKNELADTSGNEVGDDASKNYPCEVCGKAFKKVGQLNQHMKTHDENRKKDTRTRICYTCGKEVLAIYYSKHMRYDCSFCLRSLLTAS